MAANVHLTEDDAKMIANNIQNIAKSIEESSKILDTTTETLISGAAGAEVDGLRVFGKKLINTIGDLAISALEMGGKIWDFIDAMIKEDEEAAKKIKDSIN